MSEPTQDISINGDVHVVPLGITVEGLLAQLQIDRRHVAVEQNRKLVTKDDYGVVEVQAGDLLEIVTLVGGG